MIKLKTGYIVFYSGKSFISRLIKFFIYFFNLRIKKPTNWIPSHMGTLFIEGDEVLIGESIWLRYKLQNFYEEYKQGHYIIMKPIIDFTEEEQEIGKQYIIKLTSTGSYQWWKYPAWAYYALTGKKWMFGKKSSDYNSICYESTARVLEKMRPGFFPKDYEFELAYYGDIMYDKRMEIMIDKK